jgi:glycine cleavage system H protein
MLARDEFLHVIACKQAPTYFSMSNVPTDRKYAKSHEWLKLESDGTATVGITDHAQNSLGDITFVQLPKVGAAFKAGESFGVVESVKAASDLYLPVAGTVVAVNTALDGAPETVNQSPDDSGWMIKLKIANPDEVGALLSAGDYAKLNN